MSVVAPYLPGARVLDLFAGSGALGLEALSRGAEHAVFVEQAAPALKVLRDNVAALNAAGRIEIVKADAVKYVAGLDAGAFDVAFADPPYAHDAAVKVAERWLAVPFARVLGVEHTTRVTLPPGGDLRRYGDTAITFYRAGRPDEA